MMVTIFALLGFCVWIAGFAGLTSTALQAGEDDWKMFVCILFWPVAVAVVLLWEPLGWLLRKVRP